MSHPELFRRPSVFGADLMVVVANWPASRAHHWRALLIARAIENQAFVVGVNRVGSDPLASYAGGSLAADPQGRVLAELDDKPQQADVLLDASQVARWRAKLPALRDRRY